MPGALPLAELIGLGQPIQQFFVDLLRLGYHNVVGPAVRIGLYRHSNAGGNELAPQAEGDQETLPGQSFFRRTRMEAAANSLGQ